MSEDATSVEEALNRRDGLASRIRNFANNLHSKLFEMHRRYPQITAEALPAFCDSITHLSLNVSGADPSQERTGISLSVSHEGFRHDEMGPPSDILGVGPVEEISPDEPIITYLTEHILTQPHVAFSGEVVKAFRGQTNPEGLPEVTYYATRTRYGDDDHVFVNHFLVADLAK